jgi:hypothetical protein
MRFNVAFSFANRVFKLSDTRFHEYNEKKIIKTLRINNYPNNVIRRIIRKIKYQEQGRNDLITNADGSFHSCLDDSVQVQTSKKLKFSSFNYIPILGEEIKKEFKDYNEKLSLAFKPPIKLQSIYSNTKNKIDKTKHSNLIYKIHCGDCQAIYIGETSKHLETRMNRHKYDIKNKDNDRGTKTALAIHCRDKKHNPDFEKTQILAFERQKQKRELLEST